MKSKGGAVLVCILFLTSAFLGSAQNAGEPDIIEGQSPTQITSQSIVADAGEDQIVNEGDIVHFNASASTVTSSASNAWVQMNRWPSPREHHAMAYDSESDKVILFGGSVSTTWPRETWAYDSNTNMWTNMNPVISPSNRWGHTMVYDSESDRIILFGGHLEAGETWVYDYNTNTWTNMNPINSPSSRRDHTMVYDSESDRVILFGGRYVLDFVEDVMWAYDYNTNTWTELGQTTQPAISYELSMAYDSESDRAILFGGHYLSSWSSDETWAYDYNSNTWTNMNPPSKHPARAWSNGMVYDSESDRIVLFGGKRYYLSDQTWTYDFNTNVWDNMNPPVRPRWRFLHAMAYDSQSDRVVMFGGRLSLRGIGKSDETWTYDSNNNMWQWMNPDPYPRAHHAMAYDSESDRTIFFGGWSALKTQYWLGPDDADEGETWAYDYETNIWSNMNPTVRPNFYNRYHRMVYDSESDRMILVSSLWRTWTYDYNTNTWTDMGYRTLYPQYLLMAFRLAYDSESDKVILYGGYAETGSTFPYTHHPYLNHTWAYDYNTNTWTNMNPAITPPSLASHSLAYDRDSDKIILFGGQHGRYLKSIINETWAYDYNSNIWTNMTPTISPHRRIGHEMEYNERIDKIILVGGYYPGYTINNTWYFPEKSYSNDTWAYDYETNTWTNLNPLESAPNIVSHGMVYDSQCDKIIIFGGFAYDAPSFPSEDTWVYPMGEVGGGGSNIISYEWDFESDGVVDYIETQGNAPDEAFDGKTTHVYGDDGNYTVTLTVRDDQGSYGTDSCLITVLNLDPTVIVENVTLDVEIGLRVAGRKFNDVGMTLYEEGVPMGYLSVERMPGSPNDQMAWMPISLDLSNSYNATVTYLPEDPPNIGSNPVWIYIRFEDGSIAKTHHTFNIQQSMKRDSEHWKHVEPWEVDIKSILIGHAIPITATATDPGSDDLGFSWSFLTDTIWHNNDGSIGTLTNDPLPSPGGIFPFTATDTSYFTYNGPETIDLTVMDDDGGSVSTSIFIG